MPINKTFIDFENPNSSHNESLRKYLADHENEAAEDPLQKRILEHAAIPKVMPPHSTLRDCVINTLSQHDILILLEQGPNQLMMPSGVTITIEYVDILQKMLKFDLWTAYKKEIKAIPDRYVNGWSKDASHSRDKELRARLQHVATVAAIFYLLRDPSFHAEYVAWTLDQSTNEGQMGSGRDLRL